MLQRTLLSMAITAASTISLSAADEERAAAASPMSETRMVDYTHVFTPKRHDEPVARGALDTASHSLRGALAVPASSPHLVLFSAKLNEARGKDEPR